MLLIGYSIIAILINYCRELILPVFLMSFYYTISAY